MFAALFTVVDRLHRKVSVRESCVRHGTSSAVPQERKTNAASAAEGRCHSPGINFRMRVFWAIPY